MTHMHCMHSSFNGRVGAFRQQQPRPQTLRSVTPVTECKESRIGKAPVPIPAGVTVTIKGSHLTVKVDTAATELFYPADTVSVKCLQHSVRSCKCSYFETNLSASLNHPLPGVSNPTICMCRAQRDSLRGHFQTCAT